jgi:hypothetical protein
MSKDHDYSDYATAYRPTNRTPAQARPAFNRAFKEEYVPAGLEVAKTQRQTGSVSSTQRHSDSQDDYNSRESATFADFLDIINPLQHIPIVNGFYRQLTGDTIKPAMQVLGSTLYGGPVGLIAAVAGSIYQQENGGEGLSDQLAALFFDDKTPGGPQNTAQTLPSLSALVPQASSPLPVRAGANVIQPEFLAQLAPQQQLQAQNGQALDLTPPVAASGRKAGAQDLTSQISALTRVGQGNRPYNNGSQTNIEGTKDISRADNAQGGEGWQNGNEAALALLAADLQQGGILTQTPIPQRRPASGAKKPSQSALNAPQVERTPAFKAGAMRLDPSLIPHLESAAKTRPSHGPDGRFDPETNPALAEFYRRQNPALSSLLGPTANQPAQASGQVPGQANVQGSNDFTHAMQQGLEKYEALRRQRQSGAPSGASLFLRS